MWMFIGQTLMIIGLCCYGIGIQIELEKKIEIAKDSRVDVLNYNYIGADGKTQKKIQYLIIVDKNNKDKFDINTSLPFEIKERRKE